MLIVLETERLLLRRFTADDAEDLLRLESDPEVLRHVGRKPLPRHLENLIISGQPDYVLWKMVKI